MTLDEMLALLPDNTSGDISAADLRAIVTELHTMASTFGQMFSYQWTGSSTPAGGRVCMDVPWDLVASTLLISETTGSGQTLTFSELDDAPQARIWLTAGVSKLHADITGPSVDQGSYREVPISVTSVVGPVPSTNDKVQVGVLAVLE